MSAWSLVSGIALILVVVAASLASGTDHARAECSRPDRWPSFAQVAPDAYAIVTGKVERIVSRKRHVPASFVLRVHEVVRGDVGDRVTLEDVHTTGGCVVSWLEVRPGDRIAVAFGGDSNVNGPVAAVAYLSPLSRRSRMYQSGMQRLSLREVRAAARPADETLSGLAREAVADSVRSIALVLRVAYQWQWVEPEDDLPPLPFP